MKPSLLEDRAPRAVPARSSLARLGAWARESLIARALAVVAGVSLLAVIGGSALAGNGAGKPLAASTPTPAPAPAPALAAISGSAPEVDRAGRTALPATLTAAAPTDAPDASSLRAEPTPEEPPARTSPSPARATPDDPVDLNTARIDDLRRLPGIGAKRAEAILALRAHLPGGRFKQLEDLLKVKGVGRAMLKRIHPLVHL